MKKLSNNEINARLAIIGFILTLIILIASTGKSHAQDVDYASILKKTDEVVYNNIKISAPDIIKQDASLYQNYISNCAESYIEFIRNIEYMELADVYNSFIDAMEAKNSSYNQKIFKRSYESFKAGRIDHAKAVLTLMRVYWPDVIRNYNKITY